jgi:RNA polymerase sigma factor (sigma-70 family)
LFDYTDKDFALTERCLKGDENAWNQLIEQYQALIYSIPLKYGMSKMDADDIFGSVCLILLNKLASLRNQNQLAAWLGVTTRRECWRLRRKQQQFMVAADLSLDNRGGEGETALDLVADETTSAEIDLVLLEEQALLKKCLQQLDPRCRSMLELLYYPEEGVSYLEVAQKLGIAEGSIGPTRARCLKKLRDYLEGKGF